MADRFWVGGSGNWSDTARWSASSGGAGGASVPTSADNAIFDANSGAPGAYTATVNATANCLDLNFAAAPSGGGTVTFAGANLLSIYGSLTLLAGMTFTYASTITFRSTTAGRTITMNGVTTSGVQYQFNGAGGEWTLQDAFSIGNGTINVIAGHWKTAGKAVTANSVTNSAAASNLTLDASTLTLSIWSCAAAATLSAASSTIICLTGPFTGGGKTYGTVTLTVTASRAFSGANTFATLTLLNNALTTCECVLDANQTVTGTFKYLGTSATNRFLIRSDIIGTPRTITAAVLDAASNNCDFMDITGAGAAAPFAAGTSIGDCQGNSGITFTAPTTQTANGTTSFSWSNAARWTSRVPLPQDSVIINNAFSASQTITSDMPRLGKNITFSATGTPAWTFPVFMATSNVFGDLIVTTPVVSFFSIPGGVILGGRGSHTLQLFQPINNQLQFYNPGGIYTLQSNIQVNGSVGNGNAIHFGYPTSTVVGTFDANGFNVTAGTGTDTFPVAINVTGTIINMGEGTWRCWRQSGTASNVINVTASATVNAETSTLIAESIVTGTGHAFFGLNNNALNKVECIGAVMYPVHFINKGTIADFTYQFPGGQVTGQALSEPVTFGTAKINGVRNTGQAKVATFTGQANTYFSTPDSAANSITGDIDIRFKMDVPTWVIGSSQAPIAKRNATFAINVVTNGTNAFTLEWVDGASVFRTVTFDAYAAGVNGAAREFRITLDVDNGAGGHAVKLFEWLAGAWSQVGATKNAGAFTTSIKDTADHWSVGAFSAGTIAMLTGHIYYAEVRNGIDGPVVVGFYPNDYASGATWVSSSPQAEVWTKNGAAVIQGLNQISIALRFNAGNSAFTKTGGGTLSFDYVVVDDNTASPANTFYAGRGSTDGGNNTNWTFGSPTSMAGLAEGVASVTGEYRAVVPMQGLSTALSSQSDGLLHMIRGLNGLAEGVATVDGEYETTLNTVDMAGLSQGVATVSGMNLPYPKSRILPIKAEGRTMKVSGTFQ